MSPLRKRLLLVLAGALLFCSGVALGRFGRSATTTVQQSATLDESAGLDLQRHEVKKEEPKVVTRIVYRDGPVQERIVERTGPTVTTVDTVEHATSTVHETVKEVVRVDDRPFRAGVIFAMHPQGALYGAYAGARVLGPVEVSGMVAAGSGWMAGVGVGVRF